MSFENSHRMSLSFFVFPDMTIHCIYMQCNAAYVSLVLAQNFQVYNYTSSHIMIINVQVTSYMSCNIANTYFNVDHFTSICYQFSHFSGTWVNILMI